MTVVPTHASVALERGPRIEYALGAGGMATVYVARISPR